MTRDDLQRLVFGWTLFDLPGPSLVLETDVSSPVTGLNADRYTIDMDDGWVSYGWHFEVEGATELVIVHQGHTQGDEGLEDLGTGETIRQLVAAGVSVLGFEMCSRASNSGPVDHDLAYTVPNPGIWYLHAYPVWASLQLVQGLYDSIYMTGLSGGGWATTLYAALDPSVDVSVGVGGSLPTDLRAAGSVGDLEQSALARFVSYEELYRLAADGVDRTRHQVLNPIDPCCFAKSGSTGAYGATYHNVVIRHLNRLTVGAIHFAEITRPDHVLNQACIDYLFETLNLVASPPLPPNGTVDNGDFELPALPPWSIDPPGSWVAGPPSGWQGTGTVGVFHPATTQYPGGSTQVAYANDGGSVWQDVYLAEAGVEYRLTVRVGRRADKPWTGYSVAIMINGVSKVVTSGMALAPGEWGQAECVYVATPADAGQPVAVRLSSVGTGQVNFDDVELTSSTT